MIISPLTDTSLSYNANKKLELSPAIAEKATNNFSALAQIQRTAEISKNYRQFNQNDLIPRNESSSLTTHNNAQISHWSLNATKTINWSIDTQLMLKLLEQLFNLDTKYFVKLSPRVFYEQLERLENELLLIEFNNSKSQLTIQQLFQLRFKSTILASGIFYENHILKALQKQWSARLLHLEDSWLGQLADSKDYTQQRLAQQSALLFNQSMTVNVPLTNQQNLWVTIFFPDRLFRNIDRQNEHNDETDHQHLALIGEADNNWQIQLKLELPALGKIQFSLNLNAKHLRLKINCQQNQSITYINQHRQILLEQLKQQKIITDSLTCCLAND